MVYKPQSKMSMKLPSSMNKTTDKAVSGIVDVTKIATTGMVAVGVIGAVGTAFKK